MSALRVLTFNFHEPYLCMMARTGHDYTIGLFSEGPMARSWQTRYRPRPANMVPMDESQWRTELSQGKFDVVIAQNENNANSIADLVARSRTPALLVLHNRRTFLEAGLRRAGAEKLPAYAELLARLNAFMSFVYISESKRADYKIDGRVIRPGIDVEEFGGYRGDIEAVLRVGNQMRARDLMFDVDFQERVCAGFETRVMGDDPLIPGATPSSSYEELLDAYRSHRCLLHVTREDFEDGYNLATLEAMACGTPVVSLANPTSPLTDGFDGFVSYEADVLCTRIQELLDDRDLARRVGERGRETVASKFPMSKFVESWSEAIATAAEESPRSSKGRMHVPRMKLLMEYMASPFTTGRYLERALRAKHRVVSAGFRCPDKLLEHWGFTGEAPEYGPLDIDLPLYHTYEEILSRLPKDFQPELFLWVDWSIQDISPDISRIPSAKIAYMIDTHLNADSRIKIARNFEFTFLAQKAQVPLFEKSGVPNVHWLPLACSPELHAVETRGQRYDFAYVGNPNNDPFDRRTRLLETLKARFPKHFVGRAWPEDMARIYAQAKIVVNAGVNNDLNMRVFEAIASGALLITDSVEGLEDLFTDGEHLVVYRRDEDLPGIVERYLQDGSARERIAKAGQKLVLAKHTYAARLEEMFRKVLESLGYYGGISGESRFSFGGYYRSPRREMLPFVPATAKRVLDVGCGAGEFGRQLKLRGVEKVIGFEIVERAWRLAKHVLDDALLGNIEQMELPFEDNYFDCVCFTDVLEHLTDPGAVLKKVARVLAPDGRVVVSLPNARFYQVVGMLACGRWEYQDAGILDRTHLRFFTPTDAQVMFEEAGYEVEMLSTISGVPAEQLPLNADGSLRIGRLVVEGVTAQEHQEFRTYQFAIVAGKASADPLARANRAFDEGRFDEAYSLAEHATRADDRDRKLLMAKAMGRIGKIDRSESLFREVLSLSPANVEAMSGLGLVLVASNRADEALPLLSEAVRADEKNPRLLAGLGLALLQTGKETEALSAFLRALDADFDNEAVLLHAIDTAERLGRGAEIEPAARRYVDFYPGRVDTACRYATLLSHLGRSDEARERLETVLMFVPDHARAKELLAQVGAK
jgi:glycosyltransferase involved in cell wall biosynthesis/SAM-dependent methyltransferase/Tfp pilus assembly protein PilF